VVSIMGSRFQGFETGFEKSETPTDPETWKYVEIPEEASGFTKGKLSKMQTYLDKINAVGDNYDNVTPQDKEEVDIAVAKFKQELENPGKSVTDGSIKSPAKSNQYLRLVDTLDELNKKTLTIINKLGKPGMTVTEIAKLEREWDAFEKQKKFVNSEIDKLEGHKRLTLRPDN
jgi:predicted  nucleic acid-binding Zn-ribbon protein